MKKILVFNILFALLFSMTAFAQEEPVDGENEEEDGPMEVMVPKSFTTRKVVKDKTPLEYAEVNIDDDVLWQTTIWRMIDCREKLNYPLYYPTVDLGYRKSLVQILVDGIKKKQVQAYAYTPNSDEFKVKMTPEQVMEKFGAGDQVIREAKIDGTGDTVYTRKNAVKWDEVRKFIVKEWWFFDKHRSVMEVRIIGICPIRVYQKTINTGDGEESVGELETPLFWVYFPEARRVLSKTICYTGRNESANISYDDLFHKRRFASRIIKESNSLNDREIHDYVRNGIEAILESDRIQQQILKMESDFWEY